MKKPLEELLTKQEFELARKVADGHADLMDSDVLFQKLFEHYQDEMPYGTQKARTGDPYEWITNKLEQEFFPLDHKTTSSFDDLVDEMTWASANAYKKATGKALTTEQMEALNDAITGIVKK